METEVSLILKRLGLRDQQTDPEAIFSSAYWFLFDAGTLQMTFLGSGDIADEDIEYIGRKLKNEFFFIVPSQYGPGLLKEQQDRSGAFLLHLADRVLLIIRGASTHERYQVELDPEEFDFVGYGKSDLWFRAISPDHVRKLLQTGSLKLSVVSGPQ